MSYEMLQLANILENHRLEVELLQKRIAELEEALQKTINDAGLLFRCD